MALSAVNRLNNFTYVIKCLPKHRDRIRSAYSQQSARCLLGHLAQTNVFVIFTIFIPSITDCACQ